MNSMLQIADNANFIVNGYAFTTDGNYIRVLNLNDTDKAMVLLNTGEVIETSMDDIEMGIALEYYNRNAEFLED